MIATEAQPNAPIVLWHYEGDSLMRPRDMARKAVACFINVASYASKIVLQPDLAASRVLRDNPPAGNGGNWTAYRCLDEVAEDTDALIHASYAIWLGWSGHTGLRSTLVRDIELDAREENRTAPKDMSSILGHLVFPDLIGGQLPGTFWTPNPNRLNAPAWPKMPDARTLTAQLRTRALDKAT